MRWPTARGRAVEQPQIGAAVARRSSMTRWPRAAAQRREPRGFRPLSALSTAVPPARQQLGEQPRLGGEIGLHVAVIVEMIAGQIGEGGGGERDAVEPVLVEPVARRLERDMVDAGARRVGELACSATGSGVVSAPGRRPAGVDDAERAEARRAAWPSALPRSARVKSATEVLPLVPVTRGDGSRLRRVEARRQQRQARAAGWRRRRSRPGARLASRSSAAASSVRIATAPRATASPAKRRPSVRVPGSAANRKPGCTARESAVRPVISGSPPRAGMRPGDGGVDQLSKPQSACLAGASRSSKRRRISGEIFVDRRNTESGAMRSMMRLDGRRRGPAGRWHSRGSPCCRAARRPATKTTYLRVVHREHADKGREQRFVGIARRATSSRPCRSCRRRHSPARRRTCRCRLRRPAASVCASAREVSRRDHALGPRRIAPAAVSASSRGRRMPPLTIAADRGRDLQRRDRDAVAEGDRHDVDRAPVRRDSAACRSRASRSVGACQQPEPARESPSAARRRPPAPSWPSRYSTNT